MNFPYSADLKNRINAANCIILSFLQQSDKKIPILDLMREQLNIYQFYQLKEYSLLYQIERLIHIFDERSALKALHGICFLDFDDTLFNTEEFQNIFQIHKHIWQKNCEDAQKLNQPPPPFPIINTDLKVHYNAVSYSRWHRILQSIQEKNYFIVLLTNRSKIIDEDEPIQQLIYKDLNRFFNAHLFTGFLENKGAIMNCIYDILSKKTSIPIPRNNFVLVDDSQTHIDDAKSYDFNTIKAYRYEPLKIVSYSEFPSFLRTPLNTFTQLQVQKIPDFIRDLEQLPIAIRPALVGQSVFDQTIPAAM